MCGRATSALSEPVPLERVTGSIEASVAISAEAQQNYNAALAAPVVTVDPLTTTDTTPQLTGTTNNPTAPIVVTVGSQSWVATNNGGGRVNTSFSNHFKYRNRGNENLSLN